MGWIMAQTQLNERLEGGWLRKRGRMGSGFTIESHLLISGSKD